MARKWRGGGQWLAAGVSLCYCSPMSVLRSLILSTAVCLMVAGGPALQASEDSVENGSSGELIRSEHIDRLLEELKTADNPLIATQVANEVRRLWAQAPDAEGQKTLNAIFEARRARRLREALALTEAITQRLPEYAEGWNQKATVLFEMGRYDRSLEAVEETLEREPRHFGALAGKGVILYRQGRVRLGQKALRRAVKIHPFLSERRLLVEPPGDPI